MSRDKVGNVFVKTEDADQHGGGVYLVTLVGILAGRIAGREKVCGRVTKIEVAMLLQNGDVEGYVGGCLVGISTGVSDIEKNTLVWCVAVGNEHCRTAVQLEMGTVIKTIVGDVKGYVGGNLVGTIDIFVSDIEKDILVVCVAVGYEE